MKDTLKNMGLIEVISRYFTVMAVSPTFQTNMWKAEAQMQAQLQNNLLGSFTNRKGHPKWIAFLFA